MPSSSCSLVQCLSCMAGLRRATATGTTSCHLATLLHNTGITCTVTACWANNNGNNNNHHKHSACQPRLGACGQHWYHLHSHSLLGTSCQTAADEVCWKACTNPSFSSLTMNGTCDICAGRIWSLCLIRTIFYCCLTCLISYVTTRWSGPHR